MLQTAAEFHLINVMKILRGKLEKNNCTIIDPTISLEFLKIKRRAVNMWKLKILLPIDDYTSARESCAHKRTVSFVT